MNAKTWPAGVSLAVAAMLAVAPTASAQEANDFVLRGFVSQGFLKSSANRWLDADTDEGTFAYTEAALNFTAQPLPKVRVADASSTCRRCTGRSRGPSTRSSRGCSAAACAASARCRRRPTRAR